jgi:hypothetical protein
LARPTARVTLGACAATSTRSTTSSPRRPARSAANAEAFQAAVDAIAHETEHLLAHLVTSAPPKNREVEAAKARERAQRRYAATA